MPKWTKERSKKAGLPPGSLIYIGERKEQAVKLTRIDYDEGHYQEREARTMEECLSCGEGPGVHWIDVDGVHQIEILEELGRRYGLHHLVLEDILNTDQRPKLEDYGEYLYTVLKGLSFEEDSHEIVTQQISLILGPHFVLSFQEREGELFRAVRDRIKNAKGRIRNMGADYLAYCLIDSIVDRYFLILEGLGERIEALEEELIASPTSKTLESLHHLKREMLLLRKSVWPLREVLGLLERGESSLIRDSTRLYLRDVYDHTIQVIDTIETFRDMLSGMVDIYLSSMSNRMNEVMKVLTLIATIFMPLSVVAGIYGMNFKYMPELERPWGYPAVLVLMLIVGALMVAYFRRRRWI